MARKRIELDPKKAVGVVRVSTDRQDIGAAAQAVMLEEWCKAQEIELLAIFEDRMSGKTPFEKRKELKSAIASCRSKKAGILLAGDWDRFARDKHFFSDLERECTDLGIRPTTVSGGLHEEEVLRNIKQALAIEELKNISERNARRSAQCIREGLLHGGMPQYGQRRKEGGRMGTRNTVVELEPDPAEQKVIKKILALRKSGATYRAISDKLIELGMPARTGKWSPPKIYRIVKYEQATKGQR